jgi:hypothetical protein
MVWNCFALSSSRGKWGTYGPIGPFAEYKRDKQHATTFYKGVDEPAKNEGKAEDPLNVFAVLVLLLSSVICCEVMPCDRYPGVDEKF